MGDSTQCELRRAERSSALETRPFWADYTKGKKLYVKPYESAATPTTGPLPLQDLYGPDDVVILVDLFRFAT